MNKVAQWQAGGAASADGSRHPLRSGVAGAAGVLVMLAALAAAAAVAVVFAATLAVIAALASMLLALSAIAWRARPRARAELARIRSGHAWVAYGWDRRRG